MISDSEYNRRKIIERLYPEGVNGDPRRAVMNSREAIYRMFCQWCAQAREPVRNVYLQCMKCDMAGPDTPFDPIATRGR